MTFSEAIRVPRPAALSFAAQCQGRPAHAAAAWTVAERVFAICNAGPRSASSVAGLTPLQTQALLAESCGDGTVQHSLAMDLHRQTGALAGLTAYAIDRGVRYATVRMLAGKRLADHQLTAPKLAALTIAEQILCVQLDALSEAAVADAAHVDTSVAAAEILRAARDVADVLVDHFGGAGFVADGEVPLCQTLEQHARTVSVMLRRFAPSCSAGQGWQE